MPLLRPLAVALLGLCTAATAVPALAASGPAAAAPRAVGSGELGYDRIGVRRGDTWMLRDSLDGGAPRSYVEETGGWQPVAGDLDGDGTATVSLFRDGVWHLRDAERGTSRTVRFGLKGDVPVVGDWDGDGVDTLGLFRAGRWFLRSGNGPAATGYRTFGFGVGGDRPVVGDWDADGDTDIAVTRGVTWYQRDAASAGPSSRTFAFGRAGDLPVAGDWDHDGRDTPGLFRSGTWFFKLGNGFGGYQTTVFGRSGDRPVVRRTPGLAPGVTHRVLRSGASTVHLATIDLAAASSPDAVLSGDTLRNLEKTSSMGRRTGAVLAVNGDYFLGNGRPVHAMAADGRLLQTPQLLGRAFGLDGTGTKVSMGFPDTKVVLTTPTATGTATTTIGRWNSGGTSGSSVVGYTAVGTGLDQPQDDRCYLGATSGPPTVRPDGGVESALQVTGSRCYGKAPYLGPSSTVLATEPFGSGATLFAGLAPGQSVARTSYLGFPGAVDVLGGNPLLIRNGARQSQDLSGSGDFFARQPRTAVGSTADGRMLIAVVDGRGGAYSAGMTLGELADLMTSLGATDAINLDGGGSSTMYLNGLVADRPSDGYERGVSTALVVLPGGDPGQADLTVGAARSTRPRLVGRAAPALPATGLVDARTGFAEAAADPGSIGGLADALAREGVPLPPAVAQADALYDAAR